MEKFFPFYIIQLFFLIISFNISLESYERFYDRSKYTTCGDLYNGCFFEISNNYPISPKIPTSIPVEAILSSYRYIYLIFYIPNTQSQKTFYLEAYDTTTKETIITNGDCYSINTAKNNKYELRIDKTLQKNSFVQFRFLGIDNNFKMTVKIEFELNLRLYWTDIALSGTNSLIKSEQEALKEYLKELDQKYILLQERQIKTKENIETIMKKMFDTILNINFGDDELFYSETLLVPPCMTVTISAAFGLEISSETYFQKEEMELSKTKVINGKIDFHSDGIDLLYGNLKLDNTAMKILDLYNKQIRNIIMEFGIETESYLVTVGTNTLNNYLVITIRYFDDINLETIYSEIQIKIEIDNKLLKEAIKVKAEKTLIIIDNKKVIVGVIYGLIIFSIIIASGGAGVPSLLTVPLFP